MILKCTCVHKGQDELHGLNMRVHTPKKRKSTDTTGQFVCTVCGNIKTSSVKTDKQMKNQASESLDMSPDDTTSIIKVSDFKETQFVQDDIERVISIGQLELDIKKLEERYAELFGA